MIALDEKVRSLNADLFAAIPSQTSDDDKRMLLLLQDCVRSRGEYIYLEIGSHLGGTIQPHFVDPACQLVYSIDKRPEFQPDERGKLYFYENNSTGRMLSNLFHAFPSINKSKIVNFDNDSTDVDPTEISKQPTLCFIDGEHTNKAVLNDFKFCLQVSHTNAMIAFHDTFLIFQGIETIKNYLFSNSIRYRGFMLAGSVYVILLNEAINNYADKIEPFSMSESEYFRKSKNNLRKIRMENLKKTTGWKSISHRVSPQLYQFLRASKKVLDGLIIHST